MTVAAAGDLHPSYVQAFLAGFVRPNMMGDQDFIGMRSSYWRTEEGYMQ